MEYRGIWLYFVFAMSILAILVSAVTILTVNRPQVTIPIPTYSIVYNISDFVDAQIFKLKDERLVFIFYLSDASSYNISEAVKVARAYNFSVYLYDINKPWYGLMLAENFTIPLIPNLPPNSIICINEGKAYYLLNDLNLEDIILLIDKCYKKE